MTKLENERLYRKHYQDFVEEFTYGEFLSFDESIESLRNLIQRLTPWRNLSQKPKSLADLNEPEVEADIARPTSGLLYESNNDPEATKLTIKPDDINDLTQEDGLNL